MELTKALLPTSVTLLAALLLSQTSFFTHRIPSLFKPSNPLHDAAVISYAELTENAPATQQRLLSSMSEYGLFFINQVPSYNASQELATLRSFFALPLDTKMELAVRKYRPGQRNVYRGYGPLVSATATQYKEMFNIGPHETDYKPSSVDSDGSLEQFRAIGRERNVWPGSGDDAFDRHFRDVFSRGFATRRMLAQAVVRCIGEGLGHPELEERFTEHEFSTLGLRRYPARGGAAGRLTELEHEDSTVTILSTFQNPGLEALYGADYWDVPPSGEGFVVNIGTLIADITDGRVKAVRHRVRQIEKERFSIPFFFNPSFDADIGTSLTGRRTRAGERHRIFGEWMREYLPGVEPGLLGKTP
uniref:Putative isopenicillin-n-synthase n=1 Tax=Hormiphora californensis TaxID=1403702 RepID=A0A0A0S1U0_HORCA|nr:putative isopenicillin-n-synthase [Hormiphora californensis]